jgi:hypothetical protein
MKRFGLLAVVLLAFLAGCGGASFQQYKAADAIAAFQQAGLPAENVKDAVRGADVVAPNLAIETKEFTIPAIAPKGGQVQVFKERKDLDTLVNWYAQFPALAPYVYTRGNVLVQLNAALPKPEAEKYKAALEAMK